MMFFTLVNVVFGVAVFLFACGELGEKKRLPTTPSAWIYTAMMFSGLVVAVAGAANLESELPYVLTVFVHAVIGMHFIRKMWQERGKRRLRPPHGVSAAEARDFLAKEKQDVEIKR